MNRSEPDENGIKMVMGPGTGLGVGMLFKSEFQPCHEVYPTEGGHTDFAVRSEEDWRLVNFAKDYIENSDNVENQRGRGHINRVSIERLCAGPAVPLLFKFLQGEYPDIPTKLLESKEFKDITSYDIISAGMRHEDPDPLCKKVIEKFTEIFAYEVGNKAVSTIPYGGIYLVGGVAEGIQEYILEGNNFLKHYYAKGRLSSVVRRVPLYIVKGEVELGIRGAEECCFRKLGSLAV